MIASEGFKTLKDGETVEYELKEGPKGLQAAKVLRTKKEDEAEEELETTILEEDISLEPQISESEE